MEEEGDGGGDGPDFGVEAGANGKGVVLDRGDGLGAGEMEEGARDWDGPDAGVQSGSS